MNNFQFSSIDLLMAELRSLVSVSNNNMWLDNIHSVGDEKAIAQAKECMGFCADISATHLKSLKCSHIDTAAIRLERLSSGDSFTWSELNTRSRALRDAIKTELKEYLFYQYPRDKGLKYLSIDSEWKDIFMAFPLVRDEAVSATDCYALQQNTASVFHSMRIVEHGMRALARDRRISLRNKKPVEWATWMDIIKGLDAEITRIGLTPASAKKEDALEFYSGARSDFNGFKDEFRNSVMHVRSNYDEYQALRALTNVRTFMGRISRKKLPRRLSR